MSDLELDISSTLTWQDGIPQPQWDLIETWIESHCDSDGRPAAWTAILGQWLEQIGSVFGPDYEAAESDHFLALAPQQNAIVDKLLYIAERSRESLLSILGEVANFDILGKHVIIALQTRDEYYRYVSCFYPEGEHGGSAGIHIREGYPHVALFGKDFGVLENTLAHELTHVSLHHLSMPQWLEEGLAQMFEHDMTRRSLLTLDAEMAGRHKRYWHKHGLDAFWTGEGFSGTDKLQALSYQLAEIVVRFLVEDARPGWFGRGRERRQRFFAFLREASATDCGEAALREHLHLGLDELAARFLGSAAWSSSQ
jgi:hypothetical protein